MATQGSTGLNKLLRTLHWRLLGQFLEPFTSNQPAARTIRRLSRQQWKLLVLNIVANLLSSIGEGATLGIIFLAISLVTVSSSAQWRSLPSMGLLEGLPVVGRILHSSLLSSEGRIGLFVVMIAIALLLQLLVATSSYLNTVSAGLLGCRIQEALTGEIHQRILSFSFSCASRFRVGDLLNYSGNAGRTVNSQITLTSNLLLNIFQFLIYLAILIAISPWLMLVAIAMAMTLAYVQSQLLPRLRKRAEMIMAVEVNLSSRRTEHIQGLRLLHTTGQIAAAARETDDLLREQQIHASRMVLISNLITPISSMLPIIAISLIASASVLIFQNRQSGVLPSLVTFVLALQRLNIRLGSINGIITSFVANTALVKRLNAILDDSDKEFVRQGGQTFQRLQHEIRLDNVSLRYSSELAPAVSNIDLIIKRGQTVALVGSSGAGKSTIADLLVGLYEPTEGRILIDNIDMQALEIASWQQKLGVVSQDTFLLNNTIAANIAYGTPNADRSAIEAAAVAAQAAGFIAGLPDGFDTVIGERGYRLSGGQRQRLSLARALLREPQLLILDEATSALDSQSERLVQEAIERFERTHTVLVIAHRLSTIVNADLICVMEAGRIIERGHHAELMAAQGTYALLWQQQSQGADSGPKVQVQLEPMESSV
jgi:subfamily B ATP-binding cassette protein MsbA